MSYKFLYVADQATRVFRLFPSGALGLPVDARRTAGFQLDRVQRGLRPRDWKAMPSIGAGAIELRIHEASGAYRVVFVARFANAIYVLHAFQKKRQKTSRLDLELARGRLRSLERSTR